MSGMGKKKINYQPAVIWKSPPKKSIEKDLISKERKRRFDTKISVISEEDTDKLCELWFNVNTSEKSLHEEMKTLGVGYVMEMTASKKWIQKKIKKDSNFANKYGKIEIQYLIAVNLYSKEILYRQVNESLRKMENIEYFKVFTKCLYLSFDKISKVNKMKSYCVFRGSRFNVQKMPAIMKVGGRVSFGSFTSTSFLEEVAKIFTKDLYLEIEMNKYMDNGISIRDLCEFPMEDEVLIPPLTIFVVSDAKKNYYGKGLKNVNYVKLKEVYKIKIATKKK